MVVISFLFLVVVVVSSTKRAFVLCLMKKGVPLSIVGGVLLGCIEQCFMTNTIRKLWESFLSFLNISSVPFSLSIVWGKPSNMVCEVRRLVTPQCCFDPLGWTPKRVNYSISWV